MLVKSKSEADTFAREQSNRKRLIRTTGGPTVLIGPSTIGNFSKLRAGNQALTDCFEGFAWLEAVG